MFKQQMTSRTASIRIRTVTAFLHLPPDNSKWEADVAVAGAFLAAAQQHLQAMGYEVQTLRIATQPFPEFLAASSTTSDPCQQASTSLDDVMVANAVLLEGLAARHGVPLVSLGSSSDPAHLKVIPQIITATTGTSCTFALPADSDWRLAQAVASVVMEIAQLTGGMGNFRFGSASNMQPGIPFFPVACCGPHQHRSFAIGTESDALLYEAFLHAASAAAAATAAGHSAAGSGSTPCNVLQLAQDCLAEVLLQHWSPLEAAALQLQAQSARSGPGADAAGAASAGGLIADAHASDGTTGDGTDKLKGKVVGHVTSDTAMLSQRGAPQVTGGFVYLGLDSSLAPGLDTPALTDSYQLLLQGLPAAGPDQQGSVSSGLGGSSGSGFGAPGSLTVSSMITRVLKELPLKLTGYCGLMLAVCEDKGLAAAAAAGTITISQLLQYSAVCGCGLDTVPVPGPAQQQASADQHDAQAGSAAAAQDAQTTGAIAGLILDVNSLAYRLNKPLACRLLPLPGEVPGQPTDFSHPYMINSCVMDLMK